MDWQLADAKNRFSEVVRRALTEGPQRISRRKEAVMVIAESEYRRLTGRRTSFVAYLLDGPSLEDVDLTRERAPMRDVEL